MIVFVLRDAATGLFCGGVDTGRKSVLVTASLDHAEAWAEQGQAARAAAALAGASGAFQWEVAERAGTVAARLLARLRAGPASLVPEARPGAMTEGQFCAVREMLRLLNAAQRHIDRQVGQLEAAGIRLDDREFTTLYDRLFNMAGPFHTLVADHMAATVG